MARRWSSASTNRASSYAMTARSTAGSAGSSRESYAAVQASAESCEVRAQQRPEGEPHDDSTRHSCVPARRRTGAWSPTPRPQRHPGRDEDGDPLSRRYVRATEAGLELRPGPFRLSEATATRARAARAVIVSCRSGETVPNMPVRVSSIVSDSSIRSCQERRSAISRLNWRAWDSGASRSRPRWMSRSASGQRPSASIGSAMLPSSIGLYFRSRPSSVIVVEAALSGLDGLLVQPVP